ncbi:MAG TPA: cytochrome c biogenesis protein CcsA [Candidatus Polarisedimenticolia bacterium]|nr:cytochrome c biogenesis protein CcsA [Candidatus Polarisedimenticolia bacterium]
MGHWSGLLLGAALAFYVLGVAVSLSVLATRRKDRVSLIPAFTLAGFVVHFAGIVLKGVEEGGVPLDNLRGILFLLAWAAISVYLLAHFKFRMEVIGIVILPLVAALMLITMLLPAPGPSADPPGIPAGLEMAVRVIHILPAILGVSALFLTFAASILYLVQERSLKARRPVSFFLRLPSLERCERLAHQSLTWGFALLTFVVVTGVVTASYGPDEDWRWILREKWSLLAWLIFAVVLYDRIFSGGWRGRKAAYLSILGFGVMILRMVGA